jgi:hypothetical protein
MRSMPYAPGSRGVGHAPHAGFWNRLQVLSQAASQRPEMDCTTSTAN